MSCGIDALRPAAQQRYLQLAIFREDETIPVSAAARLWLGAPTGDDTEADIQLNDFAARALLGYSPETQSATIHDLLRNLIDERLGDTGKRAAHAALLAAYRPSTGN